MTDKDKMMIKDEYAKDGYMPKELCSIGRDGKVDDCDTCPEYCKDVAGICSDCAINMCFKRLAEYEKTGLSPQQLVEIDKLYQGKCEELARFELIETAAYAGQQVYVKKGSQVGKEG